MIKPHVLQDLVAHSCAHKLQISHPLSPTHKTSLEFSQRAPGRAREAPNAEGYKYSTLSYYLSKVETFEEIVGTSKVENN
jgi:hypothetical protein